MWNSAQREILISTFQEFFASIKEKDWALCYNSMMFWDFPNHSKFLKILSLKLFDNSWRNLCIPCVLLRITLHATCGKKKIWKRIQKSQNIMSGIVWIFFFLLFISLLTASVVRNNDFLARIYNISLKTRARPNLEVFPYWNCASVKRSEK